MDIRIYFEKVRQIENAISSPFVVVSSLETVDGGKRGRLTLVSRSKAAKLIADGKAQLATDQESLEFHEQAEKARTSAEQLAAASRLQFVALSDHEAKSLRRQKG